jgi:hypothetical protein
LEGSTGGGGVGGRTQTRADSAGDENPFDREHLQLIVTDSNSAIVIFVWFLCFFPFVFVSFFGLGWFEFSRSPVTKVTPASLPRSAVSEGEISVFRELLYNS